MGTAAIILAAGKGTRMRSNMPKVLHKVAGRFMVSYVIDAVREVGVKDCILVVGHEAEKIQTAIGTGPAYVYQQEQMGTGHAVMVARQALPRDGETALVLCGDTPLLTSETLGALLELHQQTGATATLLTSCLPDPAGYGRVIRDEAGHVDRIVEEKDATPAEQAIGEINTGTYCFQREALNLLDEISPANAQGEYYLTDVIGLLRRRNLRVAALIAPDPEETLGVNSRVQLAAVEKEIRQRINLRLMGEGVTIIDPGSVYIDAEVSIAPDTVVYPFSIIQGQTSIGTGCTIGPHAFLTDCRLGDGVTVRHSIAEQAVMADHCQVGPFAYLRPGTVLQERVKVGDFVEIKKSVIGEGSKVPHLTYLGDAQVGKEVNVGAGTITCNYDGVHKWMTVIEDQVFIGSNTNLVAPVKVETGAVIGAGSTITKDVPAGALGVARNRQVNIPAWRRKDKTMTAKEGQEE